MLYSIQARQTANLSRIHPLRMPESDLKKEENDYVGNYSEETQVIHQTQLDR